MFASAVSTFHFEGPKDCSYSFIYSFHSFNTKKVNCVVILRCKLCVCWTNQVCQNKVCRCKKIPDIMPVKIWKFESQRGQVLQRRKLKKSSFKMTVDAVEVTI